jgi:hypothetical protein
MDRLSQQGYARANDTCSVHMRVVQYCGICASFSSASPFIPKHSVEVNTTILLTLRSGTVGGCCMGVLNGLDLQCNPSLWTVYPFTLYIRFTLKNIPCLLSVCEPCF